VIPLREQEAIRLRFEQELRGRVRIDYFGQRRSPVIVPGRQECAHCEDVRAMLEEIAHLSPRVALTLHDLAEQPRAAAELGVDKAPGIAVRGQANRTLRFSGFPAGNQFPGFVEMLIEASSPPSGLQAATLKQLRKLRDDVSLQVFVTPACSHSPGVARTAFRVGLNSPHVSVEVIEAVEFPALTQRLGVQATPAALIGGKVLVTGSLDEAALVSALLRVAEGTATLPANLKPGPATPLPLPEQAQTRPATTASGLILPR
jgi:glutaredoxin-like protein